MRFIDTENYCVLELRSREKQQHGETRNSETETERRCNPEGMDGSGAERTGSAVRRKPVMEIGIQRSTETLERQG
ncbi:hypothetical protein CHARACLAT_025143 [Characodon lateralis]|uniref:Uncharacterized protein n=1 Tax=Characodon lateralis TaxID=208331 RepID=A0ABU7EM28_9TELE|nr:hypothetical protein [Characodon lateralis]